MKPSNLYVRLINLSAAAATKSTGFTAVISLMRAMKRTCWLLADLTNSQGTPGQWEIINA